MNIPLIADKNLEISSKYFHSIKINESFLLGKYGVLKEDEGIAFRGLFIIDTYGTLRQITINDLPVGRSVDETLRLVQAFQFTDKHGEGKFSIFHCSFHLIIFYFSMSSELETRKANNLS